MHCNHINFQNFQHEDRVSVYRHVNRCFCALSLSSTFDEEDEMEMEPETETETEQQSNEMLEIDLNIVDDEPIDFEWEPEERYQDFLKFYCSANDLDDKKWFDIAKKLDTGSMTLQNWVHRTTNNSESNYNNLNTQFAELLDPDGSGDIASESQIVFTRSNGSIDLFWSPSNRSVPSLQSLILINNEYIGCIMKHLSIHIFEH